MKCAINKFELYFEKYEMCQFYGPFGCSSLLLFVDKYLKYLIQIFSSTLNEPLIPM